MLFLLLFPLAVLGLAGCNDSGDDVTPQPDAGPDCDPNLKNAEDQDGDGFSSEQDCDDCRADVFPLRAGQILLFNKDATICPGTYREARIRIANQDGRSLRGEGVILENAAELNPEAAVLELHSSHYVSVTGFSIASLSTAIFLRASFGNLLEDVQLKVSGCQDGILLFTSAGNTLRNLTVSGPGSLLKVTSGADLAAGGGNILSGMAFSHAGNACPEFGVTLFTAGNRLQNNVLEALPLSLESFGDNVVEENTITGNLNNGYESGLIVFSSSNHIRNNRIGQNNVGIFLGRSAQDNEISSNDLTGNTESCLEIHPEAANNFIQDNVCD